jgi:hypothetical protein
MTYVDAIRMDCPKCEAARALIITAQFESPVTCTNCGQVFVMDWDEDAGGNVYGLPIWPPETDESL